MTKFMGTEGLVHFIGRVENIMDPMKNNRVQVRAYALHEMDVSKLPTEDLPWAYVLMPTTGAGVAGIGESHGLRPGSDIWGFFADGISGQIPIVVGVLASASEGASAALVGQLDGPAGVGNLADPTEITQSDLANQADVSTRPASEEGSFTTQIGPGVVGSLSARQVQAYKAWLAQAESSNRYNITNSAGFAGKYQMGALSLIEVGLVRSESIPRNISDVSQNKLLNDPSVWTGKFGCNSLSDFLKNGQAQELAQDALIIKQYNYAVSYGCVNASSPPGAVAGYIAACHISIRAMIAIKNGGDGKDGNGTSAKSRFVAAKRIVESVS